MRKDMFQISRKFSFWGDSLLRMPTGGKGGSDPEKAFSSFIVVQLLCFALANGLSYLMQSEKSRLDGIITSCRFLVRFWYLILSFLILYYISFILYTLYLIYILQILYLIAKCKLTRACWMESSALLYHNCMFLVKFLTSQVIITPQVLLLEQEKWRMHPLHNCLTFASLTNQFCRRWVTSRYLSHTSSKWDRRDYHWDLVKIRLSFKPIQLFVF